MNNPENATRPKVKKEIFEPMSDILNQIVASALKIQKPALN